MPVLLDSANRNVAYIPGAATSGSVRLDHTISTLAQDNWSFAAVYLAAKVSTAGATLVCNWDTTAMTPLATLTFDSAKNKVVLFGLQGAPSGKKTVTASVSGMTAHAGDFGFDMGGFWLTMETLSDAGVMSIGDAVVVSGDTAGASTSNSVAVNSVAPAHRVLFIHAVRTPFYFTDHNQTPRADVIGSALGQIGYLLSLSPPVSLIDLDAGGELLMQDAPGAATVTGTCTQPSTAKWGAIGLPINPSPVVLTGALDIAEELTAGALSFYRSTTPSPDRFWKIPSEPDVLPDGSAVPLLGPYIKSADGIVMPVWTKDPADTKDYTIDWSNELTDDDFIVAAKFRTTNADLTIESEPTWTENTTQVWHAGGVDGVSYGVTIHVTTNEGRQLERSYRIVGGQN